MQKVYIVCGVPGSGKTWVCDKVKDKFTYVPNDDYIGRSYVSALVKASKSSNKPVLGDCPFGERPLKEELEQLGIKVVPLFLTEKGSVIKQRYEARDGKPIPQAHLTRAMGLEARAIEWGAKYGTATALVDLLKAI
jgi:hypothetical protein